MKSKIIFISLCIFALACKKKDNSVIYLYYDTGEILCIDSLISNSDSLCLLREFYKNGNMKSEGIINKYGNYEGLYKTFYPDGFPKESYICENGKPLLTKKGKWLPIEDIEIKIEIQNINNNNGYIDTLHNGLCYNLRLYLPEIPRDLYIITDNNFVKLDESKSELYPYVYCPDKSGESYLRVIVVDEDGVFAKSSNHIMVPIVVK